MRVEFNTDKFNEVILASEKAIERSREEYKEAKKRLRQQIDEYESLPWYKKLINTDPDTHWAMYPQHYRHNYSLQLAESIRNAAKCCSAIILTDDELNFIFRDNYEKISTDC